MLQRAPIQSINILSAIDRKESFTKLSQSDETQENKRVFIALLWFVDKDILSLW